MSLIENMMDECTILNRSKVADGEGGFDIEWTDGATFRAAIVLDTSMAAKVAEKEGVTSVYTITTAKANPLEFHDVIRRERDGLILRITSAEKQSPSVSTLDMWQVSAEKWELTK